MRPGPAVAVVALLGLAVLTAGCLRSFDEPSVLVVRGIDVSAPDVSTGEVTLRVATRVHNGGGESGAVRLEVRAFGLDTGLLVATAQADVGSIPASTTPTVEADVRVPRDGGYRIEVLVYEDDQLIRSGTVTVRNVGSLPPNTVETDLQIASIDFLVEQVGQAQDNRSARVEIQARIYVTNVGQDPSAMVEMQVKAREVSTDLIADEARTTAQGVGPEETVAFPVLLDVPDGFNYEVEVVLWDGDVIVGRGSGQVQLLPTFERDPGRELVVSDPDLRDFVGRDGAGRGSSDAARGGESSDSAQRAVPGFEVPLLLVAAAAAALLVARRGRSRRRRR